jgi:hypothetical protein
VAPGIGKTAIDRLGQALDGIFSNAWGVDHVGGYREIEA